MIIHLMLKIQKLEAVILQIFQNLQIFKFNFFIFLFVIFYYYYFFFDFNLVFF